MIAAGEGGDEDDAPDVAAPDDDADADVAVDAVDVLTRRLPPEKSRIGWPLT